MSSEIELQLKVPNDTRYLSLVGNLGEILAREVCQLSDNKQFCGNSLNVAITEAFVNAIKHTKAADNNTLIKLSVSIVDKELSLKVYDNGQGFDIDSITNPDFNAINPAESGRGIFIIRSLMDSVEYKNLNGENVLEMKMSLA